MRRRYIFLVLAVLLIAIFFTSNDRNIEKVKKYDCTFSEVSDDFPEDIKQACRRMREQRYQ